MAKAYAPEDLAKRIFLISVVGILIWVAAAFYFVILKQ
jgi:hypothetical protein